MPDNSRQEILNRIAAVRPKRGAAFDIHLYAQEEIYKPILPDAVSCFKSELEAINGNCFICDNEAAQFSQLKDFLTAKNLSAIYCRDTQIAGKLTKAGIQTNNKPEDFEAMEAGITTCEMLIARTGSVIVSSASESGRQMNVFPPVHIVLAHEDQLVDYLTDAYKLLQSKYGNELPSTISTITGPSRTADIEKTLVLGAHGPKEFVVFLCKK